MTWKLFSAVSGLIALLLLAPAVRHLREAPPPPPPAFRAQLAIPPELLLGTGAEPLDAAIAPDGQQVAFVATQSGLTRLWVQTVSTGVSTPIEGSDGASMPAWSRDGQRLAFFARERLWSATLTSGTVAALATANVPGGVAWRGDGSVLFAGDTGAIRAIAGGAEQAVTTLADGDVAHQFPVVDERGRLVYIALRRNGARVVRLAARADNPGAAIDLTETSAHAEVHADMLVHVRDDVLLAQRLNDDQTALVGRSTALATGVGRSSRGRGYFAAAPRMVLWASPAPVSTALFRFDARGRQTGTTTEPGEYWQVRLSPSGRDAAVTMLDPLLRTLDVMVVPLAAAGSARRISLAIGPDTDPVWSSSGTTVLFRSAQTGPGALVSRPSAASREPERSVLRKGVDITPTDWRNDTILFHADNGGTRVVSAFDVRRGAESTQTRAGFNSWDARWSADGAWIAYTSDESGQPEVYVQAWPAGTPRVRATFGGGRRPQWGRSRTVYFMRGEQVMRAVLGGGNLPSVSTPQPVFSARGLRDFAVTPTEEGFLAVAAVDRAAQPAARLIVDWTTLVPPPPRPPPKL